jgi:hypothetical protein
VLGHAGGDERMGDLEQQGAAAAQHQRELAAYAPGCVAGREIAGIAVAVR